MKRILFLSIIAVAISALALLKPNPTIANPELPGAPQKRSVALRGATIHPVSGPTIEKGTIVFEKGRITAVGSDVVVPTDAEIIDVAGKHIYPGLFDAHTNLGLIEINSIRASIDDHETGAINPNVKAQVAFNPDSELIPVTRSNGVLLALAAPSGQLIGGRSAVMQLDGWTYEDMTVKTDIGLHVHWPDMLPTAAWLAEQSQKDQMDARDKALSELRRAFEKAEAYRIARQAPGSKQLIDARWESMIPVLEGKIPLIVAADEIQEIQAAVAFCEQHHLKLIIHGGYDAPLCAALLKKHNVPVICAGVLRLPLRRSDDYDVGYTLPERLRKAGIKFCISASGHFGASNVRQLPDHAGTAVAYGLANEEALKAITLYPAEILGVADRVGTLQVGKDATLIITNGDPLETVTNTEGAYIQGRKVDLNDRHKRLWKKYEEKYRRTAE